MTTKTKLLAVSLIAVSLLGTASAQTVDAEAGFVNPEEVEPNTTVSNQEFNIVVENLSADGDTDEAYFEFPHFLNESLSPNSVDSNISISSSKTLVDSDNDGVKESVKVGLSRDGEGAVTGNITLDIGITYPEEFDSFPVEVTVNDSKNGESTTTLNVANAEDSSSDEETADDTEDNQTEDTVDDTEDEEDSSDSTTDDSDSNGDETSDSGDSNSNETEDSTDQNGEETEDNQTEEDSSTDNQTENTEDPDEETTDQNSTEGSDEEDSADNPNTGDDEDSETGNEGPIESIISFLTDLF